MLKTDVKRLWQPFVRAVKEFKLIEKGDRIAVGVSGGKDSLVLVHLLSKLKKEDRSFDFELFPIMLNPGTMKKEDTEYIEWFGENVLGQKIHVFHTDIWNIVFDQRGEKNPCSLCSKMRRGILYKKAEEFNCNKLALGHHGDDVIETVLINMFYASSIKTMLPSVKSTTDKFDLIRPMVYVFEESIINFIATNELRVIDDNCEFGSLKYDSKRREIKEMLLDLQSKNPLVKKSLLHSVRNVNMNYMWGQSE